MAETRLETLVVLLAPLEVDANGMQHGHCAFHEADATPLVLRVDPAAQRWWCPSCAPDGSTIVEWVRVQIQHGRQLITSLQFGKEFQFDVAWECWLRSSHLHERRTDGCGA